MKIFLIIAAALTVLVFGVMGFFTYQAAFARPHLGEETRFVVKPGEKLPELAARLEAEGIIVSRLAFLFEVVREHKVGQVIAGVYLADNTTTAKEIIRRITTGDALSRDLQITFPEGFSAAQMALRLTEAGLPGEAFLGLVQKPDPKWRTDHAFLSSLPAGASLEGFLFPDTYRFAPDATAEDIVTALLDNFGEKLPEGLERDLKMQNKTLFEALTLASIVEEEGRTETDRKMISDIFWKRLASGQPLQSDATINYIHGTTKDQSSYADLESTSPYNTYKYAGLPPGAHLQSPASSLLRQPSIQPPIRTTIS
ncbi:MAG: endolytic transglycosylase MltG [Candidatus Moraniibacteriota bacterium]